MENFDALEFILEIAISYAPRCKQQEEKPNNSASEIADTMFQYFFIRPENAT
jgi:hypothetical protein